MHRICPGICQDFGVIPADLGGKPTVFRGFPTLPNVSMLVACAMGMTLRNRVFSVFLKGIWVRRNGDKSRPLLLPIASFIAKICISATSFHSLLALFRLSSLSVFVT